MSDVKIEKGIEVNTDIKLGCDCEKLFETLKRCKKITFIQQPDGVFRTKTTIIAENCETGSYQKNLQ